MNYFNLFAILIISSSLLWQPTEFIYIRAYGTQRRMYFRLAKMMKELVNDAIVKVKGVQHLKEIYYKSNVYQMAIEVYQAKDLFREMLIKFNRTKQNMTVQSFSENVWPGPQIVNEHIKVCVEMQHTRTQLENVQKMFDKFAIRSEENRYQIHDRKQRHRIRRRNNKMIPMKKSSIKNLMGKNISLNDSRALYFNQLNALHKHALKKHFQGLPTIYTFKPKKLLWLPGLQ